MTTRKQSLQELLEKVEAGTEPKWQQVTRAIGLHPDDRHISFLRAYHGSLDAARQLHESVLPGWGYAVSPQYAHVVDPMPHYGMTDRSKDAISTHGGARAWLISILKALIAMEDEE